MAVLLLQQEHLLDISIHILARLSRVISRVRVLEVGPSVTQHPMWNVCQLGRASKEYRAFLHAASSGVDVGESIDKMG